MDINKKEVIRYLGYGRNVPDEKVLKLIDICIDEVKKYAQQRNVSKRFPVKISDGSDIEVAGMHFVSANLSKNLKGCSEVILFAATLGKNVDIMLNRYNRINISKAVVFQAAAAAGIEAYCDERQKRIEDDLKKSGLYLRPRFSPGYGDLSLTYQPDFLRILETGKKIGLYLSDGGIMIPEKSVTAVMGISSEDSHCLLSGCEVCTNTQCAYRRDTK